MTPDTVTLTIPRATADDLLQRMMESRTHDNDAHECYLICALADALDMGEQVGSWLRHRAAIFA